MKTYVLVANASRAALYRCDNLRTQPLVSEKHFEHPESREKGLSLSSDGQGRVHSDRGPRGAYEDPITPKEYEAMRFAKELADAVKALNITSQSEEKIVIVAPSKFYGMMKKHFGSHFPNSSDILKDYTQLTAGELLQRIREHLFE